MAEQFANKIATTLAAPYVAASGTAVVTSDTGMPATGTFRLRLGNLAGTILRVDSRVGTTLTVTVEEDDGNADTGATVTLINTAGAMLQLKADAIAGGGGGGLPWWPTIVDPTLPAWAWQNQGASSVVEANGIVFLTVPSASTSLRSRLISAPATPYVVTALLRSHYTVVATTQFSGITFRESGTGKLFTFALYANGLVQATKYTNVTTFSAALAGAITLINSTGHWIWLRIADDGVNLVFSISRDGRNYVQVGSEGRTVFMAGGPNQIGLVANVDAAAAGFSTSFTNWDVT